MGWMEALGAIATKYGEYDIAKRQASSQADLAAQIAASQAAQAKTSNSSMMPMMLLGGVGLVAVILLAR